jgi:hypothetical protein
MRLELVRFSYGPDCTLGWLRAGALKLATLEEPWRADPDGPGGQRRDVGLRESCVPDGDYIVRPHNGSRFARVWRLSNAQLGVWDWPTQIPPGTAYGRSAILIHAGNTVGDIAGCILVGRRHGRLPDGRDCVFESVRALDDLRALIGLVEQHQLTIRPIAGTAEKAA